MKKYLTALLFCYFVTGNVNATIFVPDYGSSGPQSFSYTFDSYFYGWFTIGVANQGDTDFSSSLDLSGFGGFLSGNLDTTLNSSGPDDASGFLNTKGEPGTNGELWNVKIAVASAGDTLSFDWTFSAGDYDPYNDFAFVNLKALPPPMVSVMGVTAFDVVEECCSNFDEGGFYEVLAEISGEANVAEPSILALLGLGLAGIGFARRKKIN